MDFVSKESVIAGKGAAAYCQNRGTEAVSGGVSLNPGENVRYIAVSYTHLEAKQLGRQEGNIAFTFAGMEKEQLFPGILQGGVLPRKTFSMGDARDKRFYLECRRIQ